MSAQPQPLLDRVRALESIVAVAYACSLPLSMTASWVLLIAGLILWVTGYLIAHRTGIAPDAGSYLKRTPLAVPLLIFAAAVTISGGAADPHNALGASIKSLLSLKPLIVYLWAAHIFSRNRATALNCACALLFVGALAGVWGTIQQVFDFHPFGYKYLQGTGFLSGPMAFAGQMQLLALLSAGVLAFSSYKGLPRPFNLAAGFGLIGLCNASGLIFAGERSAWLGAAGAGLLLSLRKSRKSALTFLLAFMVLLSVAWFSVPLIRTRVESAFSGNDVSMNVRLRVWNRALDEFKKSPLLGVGITNFPHIDAPEAIVPGHSKDLNHAHSNYLHILSTCGIIGLAAYLFLWFSVCRQCLLLSSRARQCGDETAAGIAEGLLAATVSLLIAGLFEYNFGTSQVRLAQWFLLGLLSLELSRMQQQGASPKSSNPAPEQHFTIN